MTINELQEKTFEKVGFIHLRKNSVKIKIEVTERQGKLEL
jgi:hypothetical protein